MKKSNKIVAVLLALVMILTAVPMMTVLAAEEHTHEYVLQDGSTEATCTTDGQATYKCSCGDVKVAVIEAKNHKYGANPYIVKDDVHLRYCVTCKKEIETPHDYHIADKVEKAPSCTEVGKQIYKCNCGKKVTKDVDIVNHTYTNVVVDGDKHIGVCSTCNKTITETHTWAEEGSVIKEAKCLADGEAEFKCTANGCTATKKEKIEKGHTLPEKPTSINEKEHEFACERNCGHSQKEAHNFVMVVKASKVPVGNDATCIETGSRTIKCADCDKEIELTIAKAKHTFGNYEKYDADKHAQKCTVCGVEAYGDHTWGEGKVTKEATCKDEGVKTFTCTACKATKTEAVAKTTEHTWGEWEVVEEATTEKEGKKTRKCSVCEATETEKIDKLTAKPGDVNGDGSITAVDARIVLQNVAGLKPLTEKEKEAADMNADGNITAVDARVILQKVAAGE